MRRNIAQRHFKMGKLIFIVVMIAFCLFLVKGLPDGLGVVTSECRRDEPPRNIRFSLPTEDKSAGRQYRIFIFTYGRPDGLRETLKSVLSSDYSKAAADSVDLEVFVDFRRNNGEEMKRNQAAIIKILNGITWSYGRYKIHRRLVNVGLRYSIMEAWQPISEREVAAFFEDDVVVSPYWFSWLHDALEKYTQLGPNNSLVADPRLLGFSLFRNVFDEITQRKVPVHNGNNPFILQQPCSWGAAYLAKPWWRFRDFFEAEKEKDPIVNIVGAKKQPTSNGWDYATSWKKYLIYYMYWNGLYVIYPNLPNNMVLSTSRMLKGEHRTPPKRLFCLPVVQKEHLENEAVEMSLKSLPDLDKLKIFSLMYDEVQTLKALLPKPIYKQ